MSSYGSSHSGYLHPSQYPPNHPHQQPPAAPPYPTTPGAPPPSHQQQAFYPPPPQQQQQQAMYSSSPQQHQQQQYFSSSPTAQHQSQIYSTSPTAQYHPLQMPTAPTDHRGRRSSSFSQNQRPQFQSTSAPIPISMSQRPPIYARTHNGSHGSHHSSHMHDAHAFADGEEKYGEGSYGCGGYGGLDEDTLRSYEKRYAKERKLERRPTLGGSVMSVIRAVGGRRE